ncbi:hypothetical protein CHE40_10510 [Salmonella enterica]|nr:hypothetical protein CHE40_10510 [Salmonella enterica]
MYTNISLYGTKDENVYLYTNQNDFHIQYKAVLASKYKDIHGQLIEHEIFKSQLEFYMEKVKYSSSPHDFRIQW